MSTEPAAYPKRPPYFAHRYTRLLTKTCAAQEIGHVAFALCVTIAHQEDAKRYRGAVAFYNEALMPLVGVAKWESLDRARQRAADAGWLYYEPGNRGRRQPGRYWVTIPRGLEDVSDAPCDESQYPANGESVESQYPAKGDREGEREGDREGEPSSLALNPIPIPKKEKEPAGAGDIPVGLLELIDGWNGLGAEIIKPGNGARRDPPSQAAIRGWNRAVRNREQREAFQDISKILRAIREAKFCHSQPWFDLEWLFSTNKAGKFNIVKLLAGGHNDGDTKHGHRTLANGDGQRNAADRHKTPGVF